MDEANLVKPNNHKRNRQNDCFQEDNAVLNSIDAVVLASETSQVPQEEECSAKKPRSDEVGVLEDTMQSSKSNEEDYDDDDYDDIVEEEVDQDQANISDNEDFLEDFEDDVSVKSASTTVSTGKFFDKFTLKN